eukprot:jgi/Bigna1/144522/aug1.88_g19230
MKNHPSIHQESFQSTMATLCPDRKRAFSEPLKIKEFKMEVNRRFSAPTLKQEQQQANKRREQKMLRRFWHRNEYYAPKCPELTADTPLPLTVFKKLGKPLYEHEIRYLQIRLRNLAPIGGLKKSSPSSTTRKEQDGRPSVTQTAAEFVFLVEISMLRDMEEGSKTVMIMNNNGIHDEDGVRELALRLGMCILTDPSTIRRMLSSYKQHSGFTLRDVIIAATMIRDAVGPVSSRLRTSILITAQIMKTVFLFPQIIESFLDARGIRFKRALDRVSDIRDLDSLFSYAPGKSEELAMFDANDF